MKKPIIKFFALLLIAIMLIGKQTVFAADGDTFSCWFTSVGSDSYGASIDTDYVRIHIVNNGTSNLKCYVYNDTTTFGPFTVNYGKTATQTYKVGAGYLTVYVVNADGSGLDAELYGRELLYPY